MQKTDNYYFYSTPYLSKVQLIKYIYQLPLNIYRGLVLHSCHILSAISEIADFLKRILVRLKEILRNKFKASAHSFKHLLRRHEEIKCQTYVCSSSLYSYLSNLVFAILTCILRFSVLNLQVHMMIKKTSSWFWVKWSKVMDNMKLLCRNQNTSTVFDKVLILLFAINLTLCYWVISVVDFYFEKGNCFATK